MSNVFLDDKGQSFVNNGKDAGSTPVHVPVIPPGQFPAGVRVADVRMQSGAMHTFGGELLDQVLRNPGNKLVRVIQEGK